MGFEPDHQLILAIHFGPLSKGFRNTLIWSEQQGGGGSAFEEKTQGLYSVKDILPGATLSHLVLEL
jgi:hypothetical protein